MFKPFPILIVTVATALFLLSAAMSGSALASDERDFATQTCKEVMRLSGSDRDISIAFAHGYVLGRKGTTRYDVDALAQVTDRFIDYCLDHPAENALQSFEKFAM